MLSQVGGSSQALLELHFLLLTTQVTSAGLAIQTPTFNDFCTRAPCRPPLLQVSTPPVRRKRNQPPHKFENVGMWGGVDGSPRHQNPMPRVFITIAVLSTLHTDTNPQILMPLNLCTPEALAKSCLISSYWAPTLLACCFLQWIHIGLIAIHCWDCWHSEHRIFMVLRHSITSFCFLSSSAFRRLSCGMGALTNWAFMNQKAL